MGGGYCQKVRGTDEEGMKGISARPLLWGGGRVCDRKK